MHMKNLFTYSTVIGILVFLFTSCGSISVTKRQFNKGYSISYNKKMKSDKDPNKEEKIALKTDQLKEIQNKKTIDKIQSLKKPEAIREKSMESVSAVEENRATEISLPISDYLDNFSEESSLAPKIDQVNTDEIQISNEETISNSTTSPRNNDGLSWFWIIILIVLILWLLGFLFGGLGGIIHLLLVVALILLILWLLGII